VNRHVVITGAAGGLGAALSRHFLGLGCQVTGLDRAELPADLIATPRFVAQQADIVDEAAMEAAMEEAAARGPLSAVVANAAVTDLEHHDTLKIPYEIWQRVLRVNVDGAFVTARSAARRMAQAGGGGNIVFVTSSLALLSEAREGDAPYCASKAAVEMLARVMAKEYAGYGINVNTVYPSVMIDTGFFSHWSASARAELAPPTVLNETVEHLAALRPGAVTGRSLDHERWGGDPAYRASWGAAP
jgi:3-oxoacyl-[acyl-carrier protein] reductase